MRLRLTVSRYELPSVDVLWNADPAWRIAELLENIHRDIPLQTEHWDFQDYRLEHDGYECLHYQTVGEVLKEDDAVQVVPLETKDIRIRRILGRHQITSDGRHLVDGVAYGRPYPVKRFTRPMLSIPPRHAISNRVYDEENDDYDGQEYDDDYEDEEEQLYPDEGGQIVDEDEAEAEQIEAQPPAKRRKVVDIGNDIRRSTQRKSTKNRHVAFVAPSMAQTQLVLAGNQDEDDEEDDDFAPEDDDAMSDIEEDEADSDSDEEESDASESSSESDEDSEGSDEDESSEGESEESSSEGDEPAPPPTTTTKATVSTQMRPRAVVIKQKQAPTQPRAPPGQGQNSTQMRNIRRRATKKLEFLKKRYNLPSNISKDDIRRHAESHGIEGDLDTVLQQYIDEKIEYDGNLGPYGLQPEASQNESAPESADHEEEDAEESDSDDGDDTDDSTPSEEGITQPPGHVTVPSGDEPRADTQLTGSQLSAEMQVRREALLAALDGGGVYATEDPHAAIVGAPKVLDAPETRATPPSKRAKLDVASSQRLLLGSLGVRVPRTAEDREKTQQKLAAQAQRKPITKVNGTPRADTAPQAEGDNDDEDVTDPEYWRKYINLTAIECVDENVELGEPPFPYYHYWNESKNGKKRKRDHGMYMAKKSRRDNYTDHAENYYGNDGLDYDDAGDGLNYDDAEDGAEFVDAQAFVVKDLQGQQTSSETVLQAAGSLNPSDAVAIEVDLPLPPTDIETLPLTTVNALHIGDVIVFTQLEVSAATNWQPSVSPRRTARVVDITEEAVLELQLAKRDVTQHEYDEEGQRVYSKFEMEGADDEDEGVIFASKDEFVEIRFLCSLQPVAEEDNSVIVSKGGDVDVQTGLLNEVVEEEGGDVDDTVAGLDEIMDGEK
ncbi:hypothetical protein MBLNU457_g0119t2 [Dothideomycetes sp. NU457]